MSSERVTIVTGGERGIGRGIVERLLADGWIVVAAGLDDEAGARLPPSFHYRRCDVGDELQVASLLEETIKRFGRLDGLVLNAGIASPERAPLESLELAEWERVLRVNLTGPLLCAKHAAAHLRAARGSIVAIASTRASMSEPNTFAYSASKGGLVSLVHALAISLGPQIRVNAVSPGWIHLADESELRAEDHSQHPVGRVGRAADVAAAVAYLLGPDAGFVTGQNLAIDGGMTKKMIYAE